MPQEEPLDLEAIEKRRQERKAARLKPQAKQRGVMEDALDDAWEFAKGLYQIIPTTVKGWKEIGTTDLGAYKQLFTDPDTSTHAKEMGIAFWDAVKEPYQKHGLGVVVRRPVTFASDALTVFSLGLGSVAKTARLARAAGAGEKATKLIQFAENAQKLPGRLARKGIDKAVLTASGGKYDLAKRREWLRIKREELGGASVRFADDMEKVGKQIVALNDQEAEMFHKLRTFGNDAEFGINIDQLRANPKVAKAFGSYKKLAKEVWEENLGRRGTLGAEIDVNGARTYAAAEEALAKKFAAEAFGKVDDATIAAARERIKALKVKPVYGTSLHPSEVGKASILDDFFESSPTREAGKVGFLEKFTGAKGAVKDPRVYIPKSIEHYRKQEAKFRLTERTLESEDLIQNAKFAGVSDGQRTPQGAYGKYFEDKVRAEAVEAITDPTIKRLLRQEFSWNKPAGIIKLYDSVLGLFKKAATRWNPRWYTGNAIGDAVLGTIAGADWVQGYKMLKKGAMPSEVLANVSLATDEFGRKGGWLERAVDMSNEIDRATRAGIITREVARNLKSAGIAFEGSSEIMEQVLRSTQAFSDVQVEMRLLKEQVARRSNIVRELDAEIAALVKEKKFANASLLDAKRDAVLTDITDDLAKKGVLEQRIPALKPQVEIARQAVDRANAFVGEYLGLSNFEQQVMRRIVPFYAWQKAMTMLAFRLPFLSPVKTFLWNRYSTAMWSMIGDKEMPEYTKGYVPVFARANGDTVWLPLGGFSPFNSLKTARIGGVPVPSIANVVGGNPIFNLAFHLHGGKTVFDRSQVPYGEQMVNITNGDVYEYREDGKIEKVIPQTPLISGIVHMFPITNLVQDVLTPYVVSKYDAFGFPEPKLKSDGSYMYPREYWQQLASLAGVKLESRSRESYIKSEKIKVHQAMVSLRKAYRKANPEEREMIRQTMQDYAKGAYRRIAQ